MCSRANRFTCARSAAWSAVSKRYPGIRRGYATMMGSMRTWILLAVACAGVGACGGGGAAREPMAEAESKTVHLEATVRIPAAGDALHPGKKFAGVLLE